MTSQQSTNDVKRKLDDSLAMLHSLFAHPAKKHSTDTTTPITARSKNTLSPSMTSTDSSPALSTKQQSTIKKRVFLPPKPAILDKLSRLTASRPTLQDSIAASIAASAPTHRASVLAVESESTTAPKEESSTATTIRPLPNNHTDSSGSTKMRYLPWSREQFHERLETFKPSTWFDKPKMVNAVECAKYGWINKGDDRLECCGGCGGMVIVKCDQFEEKPSPLMDSSIQDTENDLTGNTSAEDFGLGDTIPDLDIEALGPKFHAMLTSNHAVGCPWKAHPCDNSIYKFPVLSQSQARSDFLDRAKELEKMKGDPLIDNFRHPLTTQEVEQLTRLFAKDVEEKFLILSLFGWSATVAPKALACEACHTRCTYIPSFSFKKTDSQDGMAKDNDTLMEGDEDGDEASFDTVQAHKWYCYWVDPEHNENGQVGWKILCRLLTMGLTGQFKRDQTQVDQQEASSAEPSSIEPREAVAMVKRILRGQVSL